MCRAYMHAMVASAHAPELAAECDPWIGAEEGEEIDERMGIEDMLGPLFAMCVTSAGAVAIHFWHTMRQRAMQAAFTSTDQLQVRDQGGSFEGPELAEKLHSNNQNIDNQTSEGFEPVRVPINQLRTGVCVCVTLHVGKVW